MKEKKHSKAYEALFVLDTFANRRAWLEQAKMAYCTFCCEFQDQPEWDKLPDVTQVAWGKTAKAVILDDRKGKGKAAFSTHSECS